MVVVVVVVVVHGGGGFHVRQGLVQLKGESSTLNDLVLSRTGSHCHQDWDCTILGRKSMDYSTGCLAGVPYVIPY